MALIITLVRLEGSDAEARVGGEVVGSFDAGVLLGEQPRRGFGDVEEEAEEVRGYGARLFEALGGEVLGGLLDELPFAPDEEGLVVLRTGDVGLAAIPWECLYREGEGFLIFDHLLVREVPKARVPRAPKAGKPWRLVVQGSDPLLQEVRDPESGLLVGMKPMSRLRVVRELGALHKSLREQQPPVPIRWQQIAPTRAALSDLAADEPMWFHYTGHGNVWNGQPILCFDDGMGRMDPQPVRSLARRLRGRAYLAFLNACRTADSREPSANLAFGLVKGGVPVVLGTRDKVRDEAAAAFAWTFYQHLAVGETPAEALYWARLKLKDSYRLEPFEWTIPVLYMAQGYQWPDQQAPAYLPTAVPEPVVNTLALQAPDQLFGREKELVALASAFVLDGKQIVTIRGAGGMGKTALAHTLAHRLRFYFRDGIYALTLVLPAEAPLSAAQVRHDLAQLLGIAHHPAFEDPEASQAQETALVQAVQHQSRLLLIFDNYESVLARLEAQTEKGQKEKMPPRKNRTSRKGPPPPAPPPILGEGSEERAEVGSPPPTLREGSEERAEVGSPPLVLGEGLGVGADLAEKVKHEYQQADAIQRLVRRLANTGVHLLFTSRQTPVGLAGEWLFPDATEGQELEGLDKGSSIELFMAHGGTRYHSEAFAKQVTKLVAYVPLFIELAASRWRSSQQTQAEFIEHIDDAMLQAAQDGVPENRRSAVVNVRLSIDALPADLRHDFLALAIIGNSQIWPMHGAVLWGLVEETDQSVNYLSQQAHPRLELLRNRSLLQGVSYNEERHQARAYTLQPVIAQVMRTLHSDEMLAEPRARYAKWAAHIVNRAYGEGGVDYSEDIAQQTQFFLDDLRIALPYLPDNERGRSAWKASWAFRHFGRVIETQQMLELAEATAKTINDRKLLGRVRVAQARSAELSGNLNFAMKYYDKALAITEELNEQGEKSVIVNYMAGVLTTRGDLDGAMALYEQSLAIFDALGDVRGKSATLHAMAGVLETRGDLDRAMALYEQSLAIFDALGDVRRKSATLHEMGGGW